MLDSPFRLTAFRHFSLALPLLLFPLSLFLPHPPARAQALLQQPAQAKPWLGVAIEAGKEGVLVKDVIPDTPAQAAGLLRGDEILAIDNVAVKKPDELIAAVLAQGVGNEVNVRFRRGGNALEKKIKLKARPDELEMLRQKLVGRKAPAFDLPVLHGSAAGSLAKLKGKVVLVEFWATWCPACRATHARLTELQKKHAKHLEIVAISSEDEAQQKEYVKRAAPGFTLLRDATGGTHTDYVVGAIPEIVVIDRAGTVAFATIGAGEYLEQAVKEAERLF